MTPGETAKLLAKASAFDQRTVGKADVAAWHEVLQDVDFGDALAAVSRHYAEHTDRLMPAHVRRLAVEIDRERRRVVREAREAEAVQIEAAEPSRHDRSAEVYELLAELRDRLPKGDRDKLRYGHKQWRQAAERSRRGVDQA